MGRAAELMAERIHRLRVAGSDETLARGRVHLPAGGPRTEHCNAGVHRGPECVPRAPDVVRRGGLLSVEEVPDTLEVAAVVVTGDAEVHVQQLAGVRSKHAGRAVADVLLGAGIHRRAVIAPPRVAEASPFDLTVHAVGDLELTLSRCKGGGDDIEDLLRLERRTANPLDLRGGLPAAQCVHDRLRRREALGVWRLGSVSCNTRQSPCVKPSAAGSLSE